jgi:hypothetical protein
MARRTCHCDAVFPPPTHPPRHARLSHQQRALLGCGPECSWKRRCARRWVGECVGGWGGVGGSRPGDGATATCEAGPPPVQPSSLVNGSSATHAGGPAVQLKPGRLCSWEGGGRTQVRDAGRWECRASTPQQPLVAQSGRSTGSAASSAGSGIRRLRHPQAQAHRHNGGSAGRAVQMERLSLSASCPAAVCICAHGMQLHVPRRLFQGGPPRLSARPACALASPPWGGARGGGRLHCRTSRGTPIWVHAPPPPPHDDDIKLEPRMRAYPGEKIVSAELTCGTVTGGGGPFALPSAPDVDIGRSLLLGLGSGWWCRGVAGRVWHCGTGGPFDSRNRIPKQSPESEPERKRGTHPRATADRAGVEARCRLSSRAR